MADVAAEGNLLFGLLAFQNGLIDQVKLVTVFQAWTLNKDKHLADCLIERGDLDDDDRAAIDSLVARHLKRHGGRAQDSLAAVFAARSTREGLAGIADPDVEATLSLVGTAVESIANDDDRTNSYSVGSATSDGQRFRVLRPHAQGGLGAVFVASIRSLTAKWPSNKYSTAMPMMTPAAGGFSWKPK